VAAWELVSAVLIAAALPIELVTGLDEADSEVGAGVTSCRLTSG
jgi:hypothetical protein